MIKIWHLSMIIIEIPGYKKIVAEHLILDYNGTLAVDGILIPGLKDILNVLAEKIRIHVVTADTFGNAAAGLSGIPCTLTILAAERQQQQKARYIKHIGRHKTIAIGNGVNDALMLKKAALSIAVIQKEGSALTTLKNANIVCTNIKDALELLINPQRLIATLRD